MQFVVDTTFFVNHNEVDCYAMEFLGWPYGLLLEREYFVVFQRPSFTHDLLNLEEVVEEISGEKEAKVEEHAHRCSRAKPFFAASNKLMKIKD